MKTKRSQFLGNRIHSLNKTSQFVSVVAKYNFKTQTILWRVVKVFSYLARQKQNTN